METQNRWGFVLLAGGFAVLAIGVATATYVFENRVEKKPALIAVQSEEVLEEETARETLEDWTKTLEVISENPTRGLSPTDILGLELSEKYGTTFKEGSLTADDQAKVISQIIDGSVPKLALEEEVFLSDLSIRNEAVLDVYGQLTLIILREASKVREYELVSFSRAIRNKNYTGVPELKEAATIYKKIKNALVLVEVPPSLAREHLAVVNSVGSLANIVSLMGRWNGDPITGLSYLDAFLAAEDSLARNVDALFSRIKNLS
jgi:hypothetical protein